MIKIILVLLALQLFNIEPVAANNDVKILTQTEVKSTIKQVIELFENEYIFPETSKRVVQSLENRLLSGEFERELEVHSFMNELDRILIKDSGDGYLSVLHKKNQLSVIKKDNTLTEQNGNSFGFSVVNVLANNIGYIKFNHIDNTSQFKKNTVNAFDTFKEVDALILDFRNVEGDSLAFSQLLLSYFIDDGELLAKLSANKRHNIDWLKASQMKEQFTFPQSLPVYILTSAFTIGSAEFISYTLKHFDKAVIIGNNTMGVSYVFKAFDIHSDIQLKMPVAQPIHPISDSNWEGVGVIPDYPVKSASSFDLAVQLANDFLANHQ